MIERKKKICKSCQTSQFLFSKGFCGTCWAKNYKKPIKKVSEGQKELNQLYSIVAKKFKEDNPICQAKLQGCTHNTTDCHHIVSRSDKSKMLDTSNFMALCSNCHRFAHLEPEKARELGMIKSKL